MLATRTLSVRLQSDVVYVTGTVNDVPTTWTQQENGTWMTTADRAADDVYRVELELINSAGRTYTASFTLYYGLLNLITDRTQADVDCVRQLAAKGWARTTPLTSTASEAPSSMWQTGCARPDISSPCIRVPAGRRRNCRLRRACMPTCPT